MTQTNALIALLIVSLVVVLLELRADRQSRELNKIAQERLDLERYRFQFEKDKHKAFMAYKLDKLVHTKIGLGKGALFRQDPNLTNNQKEKLT